MGLAASFVLHLVAVGLYPLIMDYLAPEAVPLDPLDEERRPPGMEVVAMREVPDLPDPEPRVTVPDVDVPVPHLEPDEPSPEELEVERPERPPTVAERLWPRLADPRIWVPMDPELTELTDLERAEILLRGQLESWNDSVAVAIAMRERAVDWTYTDDDGRRWGLSEGRLHLGDYSIPLPFVFQPPPGRRQEMNRRQWEIDELIRGASGAVIRETWAERAREIRRRMEEERGNRREDGGPSRP